MLVSSFHSRRCLKRGLTLIELLVVLVILAALAGLVLPHVSDLRLNVGGERKSPAQIATETTLLRVRAAIMGDERAPGLWQDLGGDEADLPWTIAELFQKRDEPGTVWPDFNLNTRLGWRGPYLMNSGVRYDSNDDYGTISDPAVLDGWGRRIIIQGPKNPLFSPAPQPDAQYIRLVSRGEDGVLNTTFNGLDLQSFVNLPTLDKCGDDVVLYLRAPDTRAP
ncbi:MAG: type II secretion system protein [Prosthecobacter sp.]